MPEPTVNDLLDWYLRDYVQTKAANTLAHYQWIFPLFRSLIGSLPVREMTPARLRSLRQQLLQHYPPGTVRVYLYILSGAFTAAVYEYEVIPQQPFRSVRLPAAAPPRTRFLTDVERERLLAACQTSDNPALYPLVLLAIATGGRKNELRCLRWPEVALEVSVTLGVLRISRTKNKAPKVLPVVGKALQVLRQWAIDHPPQGTEAWVFPGLWGRRPASISRAWALAVQEAGLDDFHFHDLRHCCGSYLAMSGASLREIAEVLGHKTLSQTMKYQHLTLPHTVGVVERMVHRYLGTGEQAGEG
jgi:integrase